MVNFEQIARERFGSAAPAVLSRADYLEVCVFPIWRCHTCGRMIPAGEAYPSRDDRVLGRKHRTNGFPSCEEFEKAYREEVTL